MGLLLGLVLKGPAAPMLARLRERGFIAGLAQEKVLRFAPPLVVQRAQIDALCEALDAALTQGIG
jgi:acetylornithine/succinyldiaminopimelate/putrescine aminotransferase